MNTPSSSDSVFRARPLLVLAGLASLVALPAVRTAASRPRRAAEGVMVAFKPDAPLSARQNVLRRLGLTNDDRFRSRHMARLRLDLRLRAMGYRLSDVLSQLRKEPSVRVAEPDYTVRAASIPDDPSFGKLWALRNTGQTGGTPGADISAATAWDRTTGSGSVVVAVIDTGVDYNHPDLKDNILRDPSGSVAGYDFVNDDADPMDDNEHGTHVAGTIGARGNNSTGVVGVCPNVKIMPLKFLAGDGSGSTSDAIKCIDWAREHGARIMSNSWGGGGSSQLLLEAIQRARDAGILFVAAAGNDGADNDTTASYPANYNSVCDNVVSVAASDDRDTLAGFSNYGAKSVDLAAPGVDILSTTPKNTYSTFSGTSMATPHVSGAAALILSQYPKLTVQQLKARLLNTADYPPALSGLVITGRLNVNAALQDDAAAPGAPLNLAITHRGSTGLRLSWVAAGDDGAAGTARRYEIRCSTAAITDTSFASARLAAGAPAPAAAGAAQECVIGGLKAGTAYYVAVRAFDKVGNPSAAATAGPVSTLASSPAIAALSDDVEGTRRFAGPSPWAVTTEASNSPSHAYTDSAGTDYGYNTDISLTQSASVPLVDFVPSLGFMARTSLEDGYDFLYLEVSADNGATWQRQSVALTGTAGWTRCTLSLAPFWGKNVLVRFHLVTDDIVNANGVWLDDIQIGGDQLQPVASAGTPSAPSGLSAAAVSSTGIDLAWSDTSTNETGFKIERLAGGGWSPLASVAANTTAYADRGLSAATSYSYRVRATNAAGDSAAGSTASAATLPNPPAAPTGLRATPGNAAVALTWPAASGADSYTVKRATVSGGPYSVAAAGLSGTSYADTGLTNGRTYYYVVSAANAGGESANSSGASATPAAAPAGPAAPRSLSARATRKGVSLRWTQPAAHGIVENRIYRSQTRRSGYTLLRTVAARRSWSDPGVRSRTNYFYVVTAVDRAGRESAYSNEASVRTTTLKGRARSE